MFNLGIWDLFVKDENKSVKCKFCAFEYKFSNATRMKQHICLIVSSAKNVHRTLNRKFLKIYLSLPKEVMKIVWIHMMKSKLQQK